MKTHSLLIKNARIVVNNTVVYGSIKIDDGIITEISPVNKTAMKKWIKNNYENSYDTCGHWIIPGFLDIHCHGANNSSFMDCTYDDYKNILDFFLHKGTTSIFPTSLSCEDDLLYSFLNMYTDYLSIESDMNLKSMLQGVHLEGPFLSLSKAGAQSKSHCKKSDITLVKELVDKYPIIRRWTIAPEVDSGYQLATYLLSKKVLVSAGHTDALYENMCAAIKNGYTHMTHLYSGMNSLVYIDGLRKAGAVEAALLANDVSVEIIADGIHLPYPIIEIVYKLKSADNIAIISDAMRATGTTDTSSILGNRITGTPVILEDRVAKLSDRSSLAGSISTQIDMFRGLVTNTDIPFTDIVKMFTITPARIMGINNTIGSIEVGCAADFIELDENLEIVNVFKGGNIV